jgi:hypothetical protein
VPKRLNSPANCGYLSASQKDGGRCRISHGNAGLRPVSGFPEPRFTRERSEVRNQPRPFLVRHQREPNLVPDLSRIGELSQMARELLRQDSAGHRTQTEHPGAAELAAIMNRCRRSAASSGSRSPCTSATTGILIPRSPRRGRSQGSDRHPRGNGQHPAPTTAASSLGLGGGPPGGARRELAAGSRR